MVRRGVVIWFEFLLFIYVIYSYYKNIELKFNYKNEKKEKKNLFKVVLGIFVFLIKYNLNCIWNYLKY